MPSHAGGHVATPRSGPRRSIVIPVYKNEANISSLADALQKLIPLIGGNLEIVFVIDGSPDRSAELLLQVCKQLPCKYTVAFHSRNFGSFTAIRTGLELAKGEHVAAMAADLQEPPELIATFFEILAKDEADVVFGQRRTRADSVVRRITSSLFWATYRRLVLPDIPPGGVDIFACNRNVRDAVLSFSEPNSSLVGQLFWVGYRRSFVPYDRQKRLSGRSGWSTPRLIRYMMDSIISFSDAPILFVLWFGLLGVSISIVLGATTLIGRVLGYVTEPGYTTLLLAVLFFGSSVLAVQGLLGCYLWRSFENTKRRPLRFISRIVSNSMDEVR
jgi:glycosyltransferase involved in cell wall biosynthesis